MKNKILAFAVVLSITIFISCNSESIDETVNSSVVTADEAVADLEIDAIVDDVAIIVEDQFDMQKSSVAKTSAPMKSMLPPCAIVTVVLTGETWTRTIDFGAQGCSLPNGNVVKGKIIVSFSRNFATPMRTIIYKLQGFYHNDKLIEGNKTIIHEHKTSDLLTTIHPVTTHSIDLSIISLEGKTYTRKGTRVREMVEGFTSITNWEDNVFKVLGNHITIFPNGSKQTSTIKMPLLVKMSCKIPVPVSGVAEIVKNNGTAILDYGNGACDKLGTITINGIAKEIMLRK